MLKISLEEHDLHYDLKLDENLWVLTFDNTKISQEKNYEAFWATVKFLKYGDPENGI